MAAVVTAHPEPITMADRTTGAADRAVPLCVGIIMDGNRRWARERRLPTIAGHRRGYEKFKEVADWSKEAGILHLAVYAFSAENWSRPPEEVTHLLDLMRAVLKSGIPEIHKPDVAVHVVGDLARFPADIQELIAGLHAKNDPAAERHLWVCAGYGGRQEVVAAVNTLVARGVHEVSEADISNALWTAEMPDPDIIIRTGGQERLSNFLLWRSAYSEFFFLDTYWPAFTRSEFDGILAAFASRKRNYGA
jgi:undecaprenyl diphosphate synthase